jgi:glycerophosphoryl diester phosphodiesterase
VEGRAVKRWLPFLALLCGCDPDGLGRPMPNFLVIGHHGSPLEEAENTLPSFQLALDDGANALEVDVCVTQDDVLVAFHDCDPDDPVALARQTGAEGFLYIPAVPPIGNSWRRPVRELTLDELRAHYGYAKLGGTLDPSKRIPTFEEFLSFVSTQSGVKAVYVDLKQSPGEVELIAPLVGQLSGDASLSATHFYLLNVHPEVTTHLELERRTLGVEFPRVAFDSEAPGALDETRREGLRDMSIGFTPSRTWSGTKKEVAQAVNVREAGGLDSVMVWTIDRETELAELLYYSVDGIITNEPALLHRMWQETMTLE